MKSYSIDTFRFLLKDRHILFGEYFIILLFSLFPLFRHFPYYGTLYLSWEGAYRLYLGQVPFRDFGLPMGFGYWIIPAFFFKIFGPYLFTLVKAQAFINIISALAFRSILKSFKVQPPIRVLAVLLYIISYSYINYWPWYNHTVIVFELIGISFVLKYIFNIQKKFRLFHLFIGAFFIFMSFFTKQDAGAFAFLIGFSLIICHAIYEKDVTAVVWFLAFYFVIAIGIILPFVPYNIAYWFNYGQPPHYDRISLYDFLNILMSDSSWLKFYILVIVLILIGKSSQFKLFISNKCQVLFTVLILGILLEASVIQVTSYMPKNGNIFFHSFAIIYIFIFSDLYRKINFRKPFVICLVGVLILLWWSPYPWNYANAVVLKHFPELVRRDTNRVSIENYLLDNNSEATNNIKWGPAPWRQFSRVDMPEETIKGIEDILNMDVVKEKRENIRLLNMSELTPLENIIGCTPEAGNNIPLWYQKNIGMFQSQIDDYASKIKNNYYDVVLFEYLPRNNGFFPFEIKNVLEKYYQQVNSFLAPRGGFTQGPIEVFVKKARQ